MKRILSVSLGLAGDDYTVEAELLGQGVELSRVGTDGDWERALELLRRSDGQVAAIGTGGIRLYRQDAARRRLLGDRRARAIRQAVRVSPLLRALVGWRASRRGGVPSPSPRWQAVVEQAQVLAAAAPDHLAAVGASPAGKFVLVEAASGEALEELQRKRASVVISAGPEVGGHCLEPDAVEALLLALSEKPEAEIETADLEAAVARIPLRPAVHGPRQAR